MLFNSYSFIFLFLPITFLVFFKISARSHVYGATWLTFASLFFYSWWNPVYVTLLLGSIGFNYCLGYLIAQRAPPPGAPRRPIALLAMAVGCNLLLLGYYKYANFFLNTLDAVTGIGWSLGEIMLPLGISFFTFTQIAFLVDTYQGKVKEYSPVHYALFVTYFPHLIAGPILHHKEMMPQFGDPRIYRLNYSELSIGLTFFAIGLFKKAVLADGIAPYANSGFAAAAAGQPLAFFEAWGGALAYTFQLYFDFSGYCDMAVGLSRLFGIRLPLNFDSPYKSLNIVEFWRRWHMTLSRFLRDYLYVPLGGNRKGKARRYVNLMLTMLLGGLWHGAGWTFVIWGGLHGFYLVVNHAWQAILGKAKIGRRPATMFGALSGWAVTFVAVVVGWVFFRAPTTDTAITMLAGMAGLNGISLPIGLAGYVGFLRPLADRLGIEFTLGGGTQFVMSYVWIIALAGIAFLMPNTQEFVGLRLSTLKDDPDADPVKEPADAKRENPLGRLLKWRPSRGWAVVVGLILAAGLLTLSSVTEFLYFQF